MDAATINKVKVQKLVKIIDRVGSNILSKPGEIFTTEETERLQSMLELSKVEVDRLISSCHLTIKNASYSITKPAALRAQLLDAGLDEPHADAFVAVWQESATGIVDALRKQSFGERRLQGVDWRIDVATASDARAKSKDLSAIFELKIGTGVDVKDKTSVVDEKVQLEFNQKQLYDFYDQLETIQKQIDALS